MMYLDKISVWLPSRKNQGWPYPPEPASHTSLPRQRRPQLYDLYHYYLRSQTSK